MRHNRTRRVKCDEGKPECMRCQQSGWECEGYVPKKVKTKFAPPPLKQLVPKPKPAISAQTLHLPPSQKLFTNDGEYRYFRNFCDRTSVQLSGFYDSSLWGNLVLQACETEPTIRHAVIAIGALNLESKFSFKYQFRDSRREFAFAEYSKSIAQMRRAIVSGKQDLRTTLIACLLFACFETFNGFLDSAISQVYSGIRMIEDWFKPPNQASEWLTSIHSPAPLVVEDELIQGFGRLELLAMSYSDPRNAHMHELHRHCGQASIDNMPPAFSNLKEARVYLELVMRRAMHWVASLEGLPEFRGTLWRQNTHAFSDLARVYSERNNVFAEYDKWGKAFQPVWELSRRPEGKNIFLGATTLRLHSVSGYLSKSTVACSRETFYGRFTKELTEIVELSKVLIEGSKSSTVPGFSFDVQVIVPLTTVGWRFRHRALRREAISLLLDYPRREGVWDGMVVGKAMEWLTSIEEEGLTDEEHVPEEAVVKMFKMQNDSEAKITVVSCQQPLQNSPGETIERTAIIPWL